MADKYEGLRIYTVVPATVQTPIKVNFTRHKRGDKGIYSFGRYENTRDIVQPAGRQAQQVGHVARMVEHWRILDALSKELKHGSGRNHNSLVLRARDGKGYENISLTKLPEVVPYAPITGITKACRDSFELLHVKQLLDRAGIKYFEFRDTQEDLYEDVVTALATVPVTPFALNGILDYLPLWTGK